MAFKCFHLTSRTEYSTKGKKTVVTKTRGSGMGGVEMGGRFKSEGIYVYPWLIHVEVWQKTKFCKAIIFQLKKQLTKKKTKRPEAQRLWAAASWGSSTFLVCLPIYDEVTKPGSNRQHRPGRPRSRDTSQGPYITFIDHLHYWSEWP